MRKKVFITGISGFVGSHLAKWFKDKPDYEVFGTVFGDTRIIEGVNEDHLFKVNLMDRDLVATILDSVQPEWVFHLAALSSPAMSFKDPRGTLTNNIEAQINLMDACLKVKGLEKCLIIGSAEEYGRVTPTDIPIDENTPLRPTSPYAVSKVAQDYLGLQYFYSYRLPVIRVRPFNHTGPGQAPMFVVPAFAQQIAMAEAGLTEPVVRVGNLDSYRDFTDVKDMVEAYVLAMEKATLGEVYNLGSGRAIQINEVLNKLLEFSSAKIEVRRDPARMMPSDVPLLKCDPKKFQAITGWEAKIPFETTLVEVLDYFRKTTTNK